MFDDTFLTSTFTSDFSFGFTTTFDFSVTPEIEFGLGVIDVTFPSIDDVINANAAPIAADDTAETTSNTAVTVDVLANDSDGDGDQIRLLAAGDASNGTVSLDGDTVTYTPDEGFSGSDSFTYTAFDGFDFAEATVTVEVTPEETTPSTGDSEGFVLVDVNDWYNPAWGGGFIATYEYTVSDNSIIGDDLLAWVISSNFTGEGSIENVYVNSFNGPTNRSSDGSYDIGNVDVGFQPELEIGDTFRVSFQVNNAGFDEDDFNPVFVDSDPEPFDASASDVAIVTGPTNDWGSGFQQNVSITNLTDQEIDGWSVILDVPEGDTFVFNSVWGATAETLDNGDIQFSNLSWNEDIAAGGSINFGFTGDNATEAAVAIDEFDFTWL